MSETGSRTATSIAEALLRNPGPLRNDDTALTGLASGYLQATARCEDAERALEKVAAQLLKRDEEVAELRGRTSGDFLDRAKRAEGQLADLRRVVGEARGFIDGAVDSIATIANTEECDYSPQLCDHTDNACLVAIGIEAHDQAIKALHALDKLTPPEGGTEREADRPATAAPLAPPLSPQDRTNRFDGDTPAVGGGAPRPKCLRCGKQSTAQGDWAECFTVCDDCWEDKPTPAAKMAAEVQGIEPPAEAPDAPWVGTCYRCGEAMPRGHQC